MDVLRHQRPPGGSADTVGPQVMAGRILVLALTYFASGWAGLQLALPPGYASAIWPPAGIALVLLLVWGPRVASGVWLGSFCLNLYAGTSAAGVLSWQASMVAAAIGVGASLQAWLGAHLIRRIVGYPHPLDNGRAVLRFLLLGGPLACVVSPSVGVAALAAAGLIVPAERAMNWWTWWTGDTIGVLLAAPMLLTLVGRPRPVWRPRRRAVAVPLLVAASAVTIVFVVARHQEVTRIRHDFEARAAMLAESLAEHTRGALDGPALLAGLFTASKEVTRGEFADYALALQRRMPSVQALEWVPRIDASRRAEHEAALRAEGFDGYAVSERDAQHRLRPATPRPSYFPVTFIEPMADNSRALGFDLGSEPVRREALQAARAGDAVHVSRAVRLVQGDGTQIAVLAVARVPGPPGADGERGFAVSVIRPDVLVESALRGQDMSGMRFTLDDLSASAEWAPLYRSHRSDDPLIERSAPFSWSREFDAGGRRWLVTLSPDAGFMVAHRTWAAWSVLAGGLFLSAMLGAFLLVLTGRTARIERMVEERTDELSGANHALRNEIRDRQQAEAALQRNRDQLAMISRLQDGYIRQPDSTQAFDGLLSAMLEMTDSAFGVVGEVVQDADGVSRLAPFAPLGAAPNPARAHLEAFLGVVMRTAEAVIANDPVHDERAGELAPGHAPLQALLGLPIRYGETLLGVIAVANRPGGYDKSLVAELQPVLATYGQIVRARRAERGRRAAEQSLRESEQRFRRLADTVPVFIWLADAQGHVTYANETWRDFVQRAHQAVIGPFPRELLHADDVERVGALLADAVRMHAPYRFGCRVLRHDGEFRHVSITGVPRSPVGEGASGYVVSGHDVTVLKEAEMQLRRHHDELAALVQVRTADLERAKNQAEAASEAKSMFLANMSHELRTPLHAIISFASLGEKRIDTCNREKALHYFQSIHRSGERLLGLFSDLLDLSKMEAGKLVLSRSACNLADLATEAMREFDVLAAQKRVCLTLQADRRVCGIDADAQRMTQVLRNLLSNAVKFSPDEGVVTLEISAEASELCVRVTDQGVGVPDEELVTIFDAFVQSSRTRTGAGGTGLGLAICSDIVGAHGGRVEARNLTPHGTEFTVRLPRGG